MLQIYHAKSFKMRHVKSLYFNFSVWYSYKCLKKSILLSGLKRFSVRSSYLILMLFDLKYVWINLGKAESLWKRKVAWLNHLIVPQINKFLLFSWCVCAEPYINKNSKKWKNLKEKGIYVQIKIENSQLGTYSVQII